MPEPSNTTFLQHNAMGRCMICNGNHLSDQCIYISELENYQNQSRYEEPVYFPEPYFPSYPSSTYDLQQEPKLSEEDQMIDMLKDWFEKHDGKLDTMLETCQNQFKSIQRQSEFIQRLTENQRYIPHEIFSDETDEAFEYQVFHDDTLAKEEAEQYQEP